MRGLPLVLVVSVALWWAIIATLDAAIGLHLVEAVRVTFAAG